MNPSNDCVHSHRLARKLAQHRAQMATKMENVFVSYGCTDLCVTGPAVTGALQHFHFHFCRPNSPYKDTCDCSGCSWLHSSFRAPFRWHVRTIFTPRSVCCFVALGTQPTFPGCAEGGGALTNRVHFHLVDFRAAFRKRVPPH